MDQANKSSNRYECRWADPKQPHANPQEHFWVDHKPGELHWPDGAVMRWDLRPDDWHIIWPELIDHPCALLFAPQHPQREGAPKFRDWVGSWPEGFNWKEDLPEHLHASVLAAMNEPVKTNVPQASLETRPGPSPKTTAALEIESVLEQLVVILLDISEESRPIIGRHLATLAMAPDSGRVIQQLKLAIKPKLE
jgi:hypothetical protein